ncbi:hypothetical protein GGI11_006371, partial [Coemansia sp. RSA 2049]
NGPPPPPALPPPVRRGVPRRDSQYDRRLSAIVLGADTTDDAREPGKCSAAPSSGAVRIAPAAVVVVAVVVVRLRITL